VSSVSCHPAVDRQPIQQHEDINGNIHLQMPLKVLPAAAGSRSATRPQRSIISVVALGHRSLQPADQRQQEVHGEGKR
jgi:hypothetical protein